MKSLILFCLFISSSFASPLMWEAVKDGKKVYILGSSIGLNELPLNFEKIYVDPAAHYLVAKGIGRDREVFTKQIFLPTGETLYQHIDLNDMSKLIGVVASNRRLAFDIKFVMPWYAYRNLLSFVARQEGFVSQGHKLDAYAIEQSKLGYLEESSTHLLYIQGQFITPDSFGAYLSSVEDSARLYAKVRDHLAKEVECYQNGDIPCLREALFSEDEPIENSELYYNLVIRSRNILWAGTIEDLLGSRPVFVRVGIAHLLIAEDSLLSRLERRGFSVNRIP